MRQARVFVAGRDEPDEISGADVVVIAASDGDEWGEAIRDRAPNAVLVVIGDSPEPLCEKTLFPRARVIGVGDQKAADAVVDAVVNDSNKEMDAVVRCLGERGIDDDFATVPVRIGAGGVREIRED